MGIAFNDEVVPRVIPLNVEHLCDGSPLLPEVAEELSKEQGFQDRLAITRFGEVLHGRSSFSSGDGVGSKWTGRQKDTERCEEGALRAQRWDVGDGPQAVRFFDFHDVGFMSAKPMEGKLNYTLFV